MEPRPPQPVEYHTVKIIIEGVVLANNPSHAKKLMETGVTTPLCLEQIHAVIQTEKLDTSNVPF
jgi:hypothetical protein